MKKFVIFTTLLCVCVCLCACLPANTADTTAQTTEATTEATTLPEETAEPTRWTFSQDAIADNELGCGGGGNEIVE